MTYVGPWIQPADTWTPWVPASRVSTTIRRESSEWTGDGWTSGDSASLAINFLDHEFTTPDGVSRTKYAVAEILIVFDLSDLPLMNFYTPSLPPHALSVEYETVNNEAALLGGVTLDLAPGLDFTHETLTGFTLRRITDPSAVALFTAPAVWRFAGTDPANSWMPTATVASLTELAHWDSTHTSGWGATPTVSDFLTTTLASWDSFERSSARGIYPVVVVADWQLAGSAPGIRDAEITFDSNSSTGTLSGSALWMAHVRPSRYRFTYSTQPRLRQFPRDDGLGGAPRQGRRNGSTSVQSSTRQGWKNTYR